MSDDEARTSYKLLMEQGRLAALGALAAGLSHELNNPVAFIKSNLGSLARYADRVVEYTGLVVSAEGKLCHGGTEGQEAVQQLRELRQRLKIDFILEDLPQLVQQSQHGLQKVEKAVADLRRFTRPDEQVVPLDLNEVLDSLLNITRNEHKYTAAVERHYGSLPPVRAVPTRIGHLLLTLLLEAYAAVVGSGGQILIQTKKSESGVVVEVIARSQQDDPGHALTDDIYDRAPASHRELRLHQAHHVAKQLGGVLVATGTPRETTMRVELPLEAGRSGH